MGIVTPPVIVEPFGNSAAPGNINLPIPVASPGTPGTASYDLGFPPETMLPIVAGGTPPFGQDMNGILYTVTASLAAVQAGQPWLYNAAISTKIGGYPIGTLLGMSDGTGLWLNTVAANTTNPDSGGSGWVPFGAYGSTSITGLTGGTTTLTVEQAKYDIIILAGALTSNLLVQLPDQAQQWLIINETTGAFTTTVKINGGTASVVVPQGGPSSPTGVYTIGDGNLWPSLTPLAVPISIAPNPSTLAERDNNGYLYATYLNQNSALENPTIGAVFVQASAADGFLRKISPANFIAGLGLATSTAVATAISTALASYSTTAAMNAAIAAAVGPLISTAAVNTLLGALVGSAALGSWKIGNLIINFGTTAVSGSTPNNVNFKTAYPNACFGTWPVGITASNSNIPILGISAPSASKTAFTIWSSITSGISFTWISIGY